MKQDIKEQWITALRSGEYKQGRTVLKWQSASGEFSYCCLGVLCELAKKDGIDVETDYVWSFPPDTVIEWSELGSHNGAYGNYDEDVMNLAKDNDYGKSFTEIADIIEREF